MKETKQINADLGMWRSYKCPICGKIFWCDDLSQWVYQITKWKKGSKQHKRVAYCSYTCFRIDDKKTKRKRTVK